MQKNALKMQGLRYTIPLRTKTCKILSSINMFRSYGILLAWSLLLLARVLFGVILKCYFETFQQNRSQRDSPIRSYYNLIHVPVPVYVPRDTRRTRRGREGQEALAGKGQVRRVPRFPRFIGRKVVAQPMQATCDIEQFVLFCYTILCDAMLCDAIRQRLDRNYGLLQKSLDCHWSRLELKEEYDSFSVITSMRLIATIDIYIYIALYLNSKNKYYFYYLLLLVLLSVFVLKIKKTTFLFLI